MKKIFLLLLLLLLLPISVFAGPKSANYELQEFQFGAGGTDTTFKSTNFGIFGTAGEVESGKPGSTNFQSGNGLIYLEQSGVPSAPTLVNTGGTNYNKLHLTVNYVISYSPIPSDQLFVIAVSTNFSNPLITQYVQADHTLGINPVWQSYTTWGGSSGFDLIGLTPNTTYYAKAATKQGAFTQTGFGPATTPGVATSGVSMSFNLRTVSQAIPPFTIGLGQLIPGTVVATADQGQVTISTNALSGALIYIYDSNSGLRSPSQGNYTISSVSGSGQNLSSLSQGYGIRATTVTQTSGNMTISEPFNGSGNTVGPADTTKRIIFTTSDAPINTGIGKFEIQAKASINAPPANDYGDTLTIIAASSY